MICKVFMCLNELTFDEGRAEEKPEFLASVFNAAVENNDITTVEVSRVVERGVKLSANKINNQKRWLTAFSWLSNVQE